MANIVVIYSTTDGYTIKISKTIEQHLLALGNKVSLCSITDVTDDKLINADKIVLGASIRYGKHQKSVYEFINKNLDILVSKPSSFFSVNVVARKEHKNTPSTNPYMIKFLMQIPWKPHLSAVFAGKLDYQKYGFFDRHMIRFIMKLTKGPTDLNTKIEFTNWQQVNDFSNTVNSLTNKI